MGISLQQAIEIHAQSTKFRFGVKNGGRRAHCEALGCRANGDDEGFAVWIRVRDAICAPASAQRPAGQISH